MARVFNVISFGKRGKSVISESAAAFLVKRPDDGGDLKNDWNEEFFEDIIRTAAPTLNELI